MKFLKSIASILYAVILCAILDWLILRLFPLWFTISLSNFVWVAVALSFFGMLVFGIGYGLVAAAASLASGSKICSKIASIIYALDGLYLLVLPFYIPWSFEIKDWVLSAFYIIFILVLFSALSIASWVGGKLE